MFGDSADHFNLDALSQQVSRPRAGTEMQEADGITPFIARRNTVSGAANGSPPWLKRTNDVLEVNIKEKMGDQTIEKKKYYRNSVDFHKGRARSAKSVIIKGIKYRL